jgi:hypothetical protein
MTWGVEGNVIERFESAGIRQDRVCFERSVYTFNYPGTASEYLGEFRRFYGPTMNAYGAAAAAGRDDELHAELDRLFREQSVHSADGTTSIDATYLRVTVSR